MISESFSNLRALLVKHEGLRLKPYKDTVGKLTIGVGRNLDDVGVTEMEAMQMLQSDIERVVAEASTFPWFNSLSSVRQDVVLSMVFNLGKSKFLEFKNMIECLRTQNYESASHQMMASQWSGQVGLRAVELAEMMRSGTYPRSSL